jgi:SAM-dependent methyltransferase
MVQEDGGMADGHLLARATGRGGLRATTWSADPLRTAGRVVEIGPGAGALADELPGTWFGAGAGVSRPPCVRADTAQLPLRTNAVDGMCLLLVLPAAERLDDLFAEVRRVLRPAGTLVVITPSAAPRSPAELPLRAVHRRGWANRTALDGVTWLLAAADFAVLAEQRAAFTLPVHDRATADTLAVQLPAAGLWPPDPPLAARERLRSVAGPGRRWPVPLRRTVARR